MSDDNNERSEYTIPEDIDSRIPDYFYSAMAGELFSVVGWDEARSMFYPEQRLDCVDLDSGTEGWAVALEMTCKKLDMAWFWEYYESLPWQESDVLDGIIEQRIGQRFMNNSVDRAGDYFGYLENRFRIKEDLKSLLGIAGAFNGIYDDAYKVYKPLAEDICFRTASEDEVAHLLDWMLGFIEDDRMELLYQRICDRYKPIYPNMITSYEQYAKEVLNGEIPEEGEQHEI